ncbi:enolase C-terminal domain-like protein [Ruania alkalisoli]|nr:enolase C-terminal domain-like protein [Ruania alkalisoli]
MSEAAPVLAKAPWPSRRGTHITAVRTFLTAPENGIPYCVVRIETNQPGLYGLGCVSDPQRTHAVRTVLDDYLGPLLIGRDPADITDIQQLLQLSGYWRNGSVTNHAVGAVDIALWDIKGKDAGLPLYELFGGRVRTGAALYGHAHGSEIDEVIEQVRAYQAEGFEHVRAQVAAPGVDTYGSKTGSEQARLRQRTRDLPWDETGYLQIVPEMFARLRAAVGPEVKLLHDAHERLTPVQAIRFARELEPYDLFFLEDVLAPEDLEWFAELRQATVVPLAVGELINDPAKFVALAQRRLIDFARIRIGCVGGITVARKLIGLCEFYGVRTALHGPGDVGPLAHAANVAIDVTAPNFGVQEYTQFSEATREVFPGTLVATDGMLVPSDQPGLGIDFDEAAAARHPSPKPLEHDRWALLRRRDGSVTRP